MEIKVNSENKDVHLINVDTRYVIYLETYNSTFQLRSNAIKNNLILK